MLVRKPDDEGFGLVEMVIAFFLLAIIAVAILPALVNGMRYSSEQSSTATATRYVNGYIEALRTAPTCTVLNATNGVVPAVPQSPLPAPPSDGKGTAIAATGTVVYTTDPSKPDPPSPISCGSGIVARVTLTALQGSTTLASANALIYIP